MRRRRGVATRAATGAVVAAMAACTGGEPGPEGVTSRRASAALVGVEQSVPTTVAGSAPNDQRSSASSWSGTQHLVVWVDERGPSWDIFGARVLGDGTLLDPAGIALATTPGAEVAPAVAWGAAAWLVAWHDADGVHALRVAPDGTPLDAAPFTVTTAHFSDFAPSIAWTGSAWMVASAFDDGTGYSGVQVNLVDVDGRVGPPTLVHRRAIGLGEPAVGPPQLACGPAQCFVAWPDVPLGNGEVFGARLSSIGAVLDTPPLTVGSGGVAVTEAATAWDGSAYLVVWSDGRTLNGMTIAGCRVSTSGNVMDAGNRFIPVSTSFESAAPTVASVGGGSAWVVWQQRDGTRLGIDLMGVEVSGGRAGPERLLVGELDPQREPCLRPAAGAYYLTYTAPSFESDVLGARMSAGGNVLDVPARTLSGGKGRQATPAVAAGGELQLLVWAEETDGNVYAARVDATGTVLDPAGIALTADLETDLEPAVARLADRWLVAWIADDGINTNFIRHATVSDLGVVGAVGELASAGQFVDLTASTGAGPALLAWAALDSDTLGYALFDATGGLVTPPVPVPTAPGAVSPAAAFDGSQHLLVWSEPNGALGDDLRGVLVDAQGALVGAPRSVVSSAGSQSGASLVWNGAGFWLAWTDRRSSDADVYALRLRADLTTSDGSGFVVAGGAGNQEDPAVALGPGGGAVVWSEGTSGGWGDVRGAFLAPDGSSLDPSGITLAGHPDGEWAGGVAAYPDGRLIAAYTRADSTVGAYGVRYRILDAGAVSGVACTLSTDCALRHCADGVCCTTACDAPCQACAVTAGTCTPVLGSPDPGSCDGARRCDEAGACRLTEGEPCGGPGECASGFCADGVCCDAACSGGCDTCAGSTPGACAALAVGAVGGCGGYACGGAAACPVACGADADCVPGFYCDSASACVPVKGLGQSCNPAADCRVAGCALCATGHCVDGYCCDAACDGGCDGCSDVPGTCTVRAAGSPGAAPACAPFACDGTLADCPSGCAVDGDCGAGAFCQAGTCLPRVDFGQPCTRGGECLSSLCADGVCCNAPCLGQCEACNEPGGEGVCVPVVGAPRPGRAACEAGAGDPCTARSCDGSLRTACGRLAGAEVECAPAACADGYATLAATCDGQGACRTPTRVKCEPYVCAGATCGEPPCTADVDCAPRFRCDPTLRDCVAADASVCTADGTGVRTADGAEQRCAPYLCVGGACAGQCSTTAQCAEGFVCDGDGRCVGLDGQRGAGSAGDQGGCQLTPSERAPARSALLGWLAAGAVGLGRWRARRHPAGAPSPRAG